MNKTIDVNINVMVQPDFRCEYKNLIVPEISTLVSHKSERIQHFYNRQWESTSSKYLNFQIEPCMFTSYIPEKKYAYYVVDRGLQRLVKPVDHNHFDYNYDQIKKELHHMDDEFEKLGIIANGHCLGDSIYCLFIKEFLRNPYNVINVDYKGTMNIEYTVDKNVGIIIQEPKI